MASALSLAFTSIADFPHQEATSMELFSESDQTKLAEWNSMAPVASDLCLDAFFEKHCQSNPDAPAVASWDGCLTYKELDCLSSNLAHQLRAAGVRPGVFVPICYERCKWIPVAMLGIVKAGGAFCALEPSYPKSRLAHICQSLKSTVILMMENSAPQVHGLVVSTITVGDSLWAHSEQTLVTLPPARPENALYTVFTSGTTGQPKGIIHEHRSFCSSAMASLEPLSIGPQDRLLHFASYAFDLSIFEILTAFIAGASVAIPRDEDRLKRLPEAATELQATWAFLTPTVARLYKPEEFTTLRTLSLGGEAINAVDVEKWSCKNLITGYNPAECTPLGISGPADHLAANFLGWSFKSQAAWIVNPRDYEKLIPIGAIGELLIEGPAVARGYVHEQSSPSCDSPFIRSAPSWLSHFRSNPTATSLYRTGDLVQYGRNGALHFIGRKDLQVKVRGQRIEPAEIEHNVYKALMSYAAKVMVDVIAFGDRTTLVAFILPRQHADTGSTAHLSQAPQLQEQTSEFASLIYKANSELRRKLPSYMVPAMYLPVGHIPMSRSGKIDRNQLKEFASSLSPSTLDRVRNGRCIPEEAPKTDMECLLQRLFAEVLGVSLTQITADSDFFLLGGDSILSMKLLAMMTQEGFELTFKNIVKYPRLREMALAVVPSDQRSSAADEIEPFSLVQDVERIRESICEQLDVPMDQVQDIYPCTPLQAGLMASTAHDPNAYVALQSFTLVDEINVQRLKEAWNIVAEAHPILRTRIVQSEAGDSYQVILRGPLPCSETSDEPSSQPAIGLGTPLIHLCFTPDRLLVYMHHALYDGWSLPRLLHDVEQAYLSGAVTQRPSFNRFVQHVQKSMESATSFWEAELQEADLVHFPVPRSPNHKPDPRSIKTRSMTLPTVTKPQNTVTLATEIQLAWAVTSHSYTRSRDVIFGMVSTGRATHVGGIEAILGPTIASTPLRVSIDPAQEVREALEDVQYSSIERTEYEHMNTQLIARHVPSAAEACKFQTMLVVEPEGEQDTQGSWFTKHEFLSDLVQFSSHSLTLRCKLHPGAIEAMAIFDPSVVSETQMQRILAQFQHILTQIHVTKTDTTIGDIMMLSPEDWHEVQGWNATLPRRVDRCAHHLVQAKCQSQPEALAIHSWDGDLTYGELDDRVQKLARHLRSLPEVAPNTFIGIYLERSLWAVVAQLAVLKAGAAFITLETSQPPTRLRDICATVEPVALLTSGNLRSAATGIYSSAPIVMVNQPLLCRENGQDNENMKPQSVGPTDAMYGIATSGTTGKPKVVVIEHQAFATNHEPLMKRLGLTSESRVLQFSAYSFDAMIVEHFITLIAGGCICIPSRFDRDNSLTKSINAMHVNWAMLTASVIPILVPASVPTLRTLVQGGEPLHRGIIDSWSSHVKLLNAYGPSECTVICVIQGPIHQNARNPKNIGFGLGGLCWIVDPEHPDSPLVPVGAEGELVIEGSILARGYMKVPEHAAAAFTSRPPWLDDLRSGNGENRIYKTGDIVRYEPDGSICHVRRKDTQLKIRGQRVELQEVEHHVHSCFPGALQVVADMVSLHGDSEGEKSTFLVALVLTNDARSSNISKSASVQTAGVNPLLPANNSKFLRDVRSAEQALGDTVPTYMIPQLFLPVSHISRDPNGKVDRREICRLLTGLSHNEWDAYASTTGVEPSTDVERQLQTIWARVLKVSPQSIGIHDSFFRLGGNSISSMQLVARCTTAGIPICVNDVFEQRTIQKLAAAVAVAQNSGSSGSQPLDPAKDEPGPAGLSELKQCIDRIQPQLAGSVENIYPCSPIQRGILISHARNPGYYDQSIRWKVRSPAPVDIDRLRDAWAQVVLRHAVLRTIFLDVSGQGYLDQVVLKDYFPVIHICQQAELEADSPLPTGDHQPMQHLQISQSTVGVVTLRLHINHALVDGHSLYIIKRDLALAYEGHLALRSAPSPYRDYVMFLEKAYTHNQSREFWKSRLQGMPPCQFPRLNDSNAPDPPRPFQAATVELAPTHDLTEFCEHHGLALTSLLHTVWAIVVQRYTATDDVSFGYMTSARHLPLAGIQDIVGPLFNMLVARVLLPRDTDALSVMKQYQGNFVASLDHQHQAFAETLQDIESNPGDLFNTLVSIFNDSDDGEGQQSSGIFLEGDDVHNQSEVSAALLSLFNYSQITTITVSNYNEHSNTSGPSASDAHLPHFAAE
jgi:amino acid adenylation domain-containing protein